MGNAKKVVQLISIVARKNIYFPSGAFNGSKIMGTRPLRDIPGRSKTYYVTLTEWCQNNFISKDQGRTLIEKKLLIGMRFKGQWHVCANPHCLDELLEYMGIDQLFFDANN